MPPQNAIRSRTGRDAAAKRTRRNLVERIAGELRDQLRSGRLRQGDKLPTEHALAETYQVSRTVVREAIAGLKVDGLVVARQGSGVFVSDQKLATQTLARLNVEAAKLSTIIEVLELRAAVESEAAALAAERRSPAEFAKIQECHRAVGAALEAGHSAFEQDFALHLAIAQSTHNDHFVEFFRFLGARTIPRAQSPDPQAGAASSRDYLLGLHREHAVIVQAIADRDPAAARAAMRAHLKGSQDRYARLNEREAEFDRPDLSDN